MTSSHSPGPWLTCPLGAGHWITNGHREQIAVVYGEGANPRHLENLELIKRAPDLLGAAIEAERALNALMVNQVLRRNRACREASARLRYVIEQIRSPNAGDEA